MIQRHAPLSVLTKHRLHPSPAVQGQSRARTGEALTSIGKPRLLPSACTAMRYPGETCLSAGELNQWI